MDIDCVSEIFLDGLYIGVSNQPVNSETEWQEVIDAYCDYVNS